MLAHSKVIMAARARLIYEFDDFQVDTDQHKLLFRGQIIPLHGKAFEMLLVLIRNQGRLLTKDELFELVWPDQIVEESNLTVNMSAIRRALGERANNPRYITTVSGRGYRFIGEVRQFANETLTIERETLARVTVEQEEIESGAIRIPFLAEVVRAARHVISHPVLLIGTCVFALVLAGVALLVRGLHRPAAAPPPWTNVVFHRFATHGGVPYRVAISPDGKSLVYDQRIAGKDSLWLGQVESNSSVQILDQPGVMYNGLTFSPDGQMIYFTEYDTAKLFRLPIVGGVPTELIRNVDSEVSFSPDGKQLAFLRRENGSTAIIVADSADGRNERSLVSRKRPDDFSSHGVSWSPDGHTIAVAAANAKTGRVELLGVAVSDGLTTKISNHDWGEIGKVEWAPDGSGLLFTEKSGTISRRSRISFVSYPQGEPRQITNDVTQYIAYIFSLSKTGTLALISGIAESEIWIAPDGDFSRARRALQGVAPKYEGVDGLSWTPDGHLLYTAYVGDAQAIWEMNSDGSNRKQLTNNGAEFVDRQMAVTTDNRYIVFQSNRSGSLQLWRANRDGSSLIQLTNGGSNFQASLSPDGKWIVYASNSGDTQTLWRIPIDGGQPTQLTHTRSGNPQISPDGKHVAFLETSNSALHLAIMRFEGGEPEKTFALPARPGPNIARRMCWAPDGKAIIYRDTLQGFWRQRLNEEKPQFIKGSEDFQSSQLGWSFDGKYLAFTRYANMQEIVLLQNSR